MITTLKLSNFRSVGPNLELRLSRLNALVGVNSSGKSNILRSLSFVREAMRLGLPNAITHADGINALRRHSTGRPHNMRIELELEIDARPHRYGFEITGDSAEEYRVKAEWIEAHSEGGELRIRVTDGVFDGPSDMSPHLDRQSLVLTKLAGDPRRQRLSDFLANMMVYSINPSALRIPQKFRAEDTLSAEGENWASGLHRQHKESWKRELGVTLRKLTGDIDDIKVTKAAGFLITELHHRSAEKKQKRWFNAARESDGTLRVAGILTALLQRPCLPVIGVEEPEQTVHPGALPLLYDYLEEASERSQIIITTHSPTLLDVLKPERCSLFIIGRGPHGTQSSTLAEANIQAVKSKLLSLSDLMIAGELQLQSPFESSDG